MKNIFSRKKNEKHSLKIIKNLSFSRSRYYQNKNLNIETHTALLKQPSENSFLHKIIKIDFFYDMLNKNYLYFNRVDKYHDDKQDSALPNQDERIINQSKFEKNPNFRTSEMYERARSYTYATCFSLENSPYLWRNYGNNGNSICLIFDYCKLIDFLKNNYGETLLYNGKSLPNFFLLNYGLVNYRFQGQTDPLASNLPNPLVYAYFKDGKYIEEQEFRVTLSALPFFIEFDNQIITSDSVKLSFNFEEAVNLDVIKHAKLNGKKKENIIEQLPSWLVSRILKI